jgi:hypothetical protein
MDHVAEKMGELCRKVIAVELPLKSVTIFSHYEDEFKSLKEMLLEMGEKIGEENGPYVRLNQGISAAGNEIDLIRVRQPDPYRMQVGCGDFMVADYKKFKKEFLVGHSKNLRVINRPAVEMIEFFDPDFDVLGYVVKV